MSYYSVLQLQKEPLSTSPDPEFLFRSSSHDTALKRLEIAIRLRRGLSIIFGDVGIGKTTLSRTLLQLFKDEPDFIFHMILDPSFKSEFQFLSSLIRIFNITPPFRSTLYFKEDLERYLYQKGVEEKKTIVLLIDEGQKMTPENLEVLRTLLNFETNEYKLLQLVIMSQTELLPRIRRMKNFMDRISLKFTLNPFDLQEVKQMIEFRLRQAGYAASHQLFSDEAIQLIHNFTQGYPRKISMLCHDALETIVMRERTIVDAQIIRELVQARMEHEG